GGGGGGPAAPVSGAELAPAFGQVSPPSFEWPRGRARTSIGTGRDTLPGTAAPALRRGAAGVRMCVGCGSSVAVGPGAAPAADDKPGRGGAALAPAAVHPGPRPKKPPRSREGEKMSLDSRGLIWVVPPSRPRVR